MNHQIQRTYTVNFVILIKLFNKYQCACNFSCLISNFFLNIFEISHVIKKIIASVFDIYAFYHLYVFSKLLPEKYNPFCNCFFTRIYVYVVNEISTDSNADCKDY